METIVENLQDKKGSWERRVSAYVSLSKMLAETWGSNDEDFLDYVPDLLDAIRMSLKGGRTEEKVSALTALRMVILSTNDRGFLPAKGLLEYLVREPCAVSSMALEVLALGLMLNRDHIDLSDVDVALQLCPKTKDSHRAFAVLFSLKSNEDVADMVFPEAQWLFNRVSAASDKVDIGYAACALFCALHDERGAADYDPYEVDGFVEVETFSDALRGVKVLKPLEECFESGVMPSETLTLNDQKKMFASWRQVVRIRFLRAMLKKDFAVQMAENELLFELLNYQVAVKATKHKMSQVEKRLMKSPNSAASKNLSKDRKQNRSRKMMMNSFDSFNE